MIFDVGANVGKWTLAIKKNSIFSNYYLFEPNPKTYKRLRKYYKKHSSIQTFNIAFSNIEKETIPFYTHGRKFCRLDGLYDREILRSQLNKKPKKIMVKSTTVDSFCIKNSINHIDILKIDTEGEEYNVILGAKNIIDKGEVDLIQFEYGGCFQDSNTKLKWIYNLLTEKNYEIYKIPTSGGKIHITNWSENLEDYEWVNYIAIRKK